jgi:hypothetical protein
VKSLTTGYAGKVAAYQQAFKKLEKKLHGDAITVTEIVVHQILAKSEDTSTRASPLRICISLFLSFLDDMIRIDGMRYAESPYKPDPCLYGTRENVIHNILRWFSRPIDDSNSRVYWLSGGAGCGKSTIACSIAEQLEVQKRCVSFFFKESFKTTAGPNRLFATISRNLAGFNKSWKASLVRVLEESTTIRECFTVKEQFENFIVRPAGTLENIGPILIVIDALDESGTVQQRERLLAILKRVPELPPHFRFLITSRPESDIVAVLDKKSHVFRFHLNDSDTLLTSLDIKRYVKQSLDVITDLPPTNVDSWTQQIVARSEGLFQWAATACRYIKGNGEIDHDPEEKLVDVLSPSTFSGLDGLYKTILDRLSTFEQDDITNRRFQTIMGRILSLREPFPIDQLAKLWNDDEDRGREERILKPLGSVLSGVSQGDIPVQPIHASFADFLRDESRSGRYWIDISRENEKLASALLREMQNLLRFNICELETSYKRNSDVKDLDVRVKNNIQTHLSYACRYWVDHLIQIPVTRQWVDRIDSFMRSCLLFWFEALSLMGKFGLALNQLSKLQDWLATLVCITFLIKLRRHGLSKCAARTIVIT